MANGTRQAPCPIIAVFTLSPVYYSSSADPSAELLPLPSFAFYYIALPFLQIPNNVQMVVLTQVEAQPYMSSLFAFIQVEATLRDITESCKILNCSCFYFYFWTNQRTLHAF